jgi:hypothetical protein
MTIDMDPNTRNWHTIKMYKLRFHAFNRGQLPTHSGPKKSATALCGKQKDANLTTCMKAAPVSQAAMLLASGAGKGVRRIRWTVPTP